MKTPTRNSMELIHTVITRSKKKEKEKKKITDTTSSEAQATEKDGHGREWRQKPKEQCHAGSPKSQQLPEKCHVDGNEDRRLEKEIIMWYSHRTRMDIRNASESRSHGRCQS